MLWIRIRIELALLDPTPIPYWECGSGSRNEEINKKPISSLSSGFCTNVPVLRNVLCSIAYTEYIFQVKS